MPQTYNLAVSPGAVGRTSPVAVSNSRNGRGSPGTRGTGIDDQVCMGPNLTGADLRGGFSVCWEARGPPHPSADVERQRRDQQRSHQRNSSGSTDSAANTTPAEVITPPVTVRPRSGI
ncbi:hypothetical protein Lesp02_37610 [Lentzea sp. NBRC 105346]|nr:hypothetical protein Lesp02_37610 [Lentzea sp. NBRC 105346]